MRPNAFNRSHVQNMFTDHAALERDMELDAEIAKQVEESRAYLRLKIRIADQARSKRETHNKPSACEQISLVAFSLDRIPLYSDGSELYTIDEDFNRAVFSL
ncbi:hypothetical protein KKJ09_12630 [Xenorhabdus bovienii]|uniref:hypothetical protein n=1 Tax=Xenorhabdus bovienii TaxID=40576 RepID=UPI0023B2DFAB|nr:hypothetical protein [Xenorhabdus bovienii]MDE9494407.1 hypothetical protein [Xenorhabdus bovienii]MDE9502846.1 hypothetical protein [Xenorhabdus bovienii]MDE9526461.1 hypothetical protein [Xenorhabdus bovienii]